MTAKTTTEADGLAPAGRLGMAACAAAILSLVAALIQLFKVDTDGSTTQVTNVTVTPSIDGLKATLNPFGTSTTLLA